MRKHVYKIKNSLFILALLLFASFVQSVNGAVCDISPQEIKQLRQKLVTAVNHESKGEYSKAIQLLEIVRASGCWEPIHALHLGDLYMHMGQYADALNNLEDAQSKGIIEAELFPLLGEAYFRVGNHQKAEAAFSTGIHRSIEETRAFSGDLNPSVIDPARSELYVHRAEVYSVQGKRQLAIKDLRAAVHIDPYNSKAKAQLKQLLQNASQQSAADK